MYWPLARKVRLVAALVAALLTTAACSQHNAPASTATRAATAALAGTATPAAAVPASYQALYAQIQQIIHDTDASISAKWDGSRYPVLFSNWLLSANSNAASQIMNSGFSLTGAKKEVDAMRALGVQAVTVEIGYPVFDRDFFTSLGKDPQLADQFMTYYKGLAQYVRSLNMKLIVEANPLLTVSIASAGSPLDPTSFYKSLTVQQYQSGRSAHNVLVARDIRPDYFSLQTEPDTEVREVQNQAIGAVINDPAADAPMVAGFVKDLDTAAISGLHSSIVVGAGAGPWVPNWEQYATAFAGVAGLDLIETHIYNLQPSLDEINRVGRIADIAHAAGKRVGMAEFWANKSLTTSDSIFDIRVRDDFSFWSPLDQQFLALIAKLANYKRIDYVTPTGWLNLYTYLDYGSLPCTPSFPAAIPTPNRACDDQLQAQQIRQAGQALNAGGASYTGAAYQRLIAQYSK